MMGIGTNKLAELQAERERLLNAANRIAGECTNVITVNPYLCERNIAPTNLKFPVSRGF